MRIPVQISYNSNLGNGDEADAGSCPFPSACAEGAGASGSADLIRRRWHQAGTHGVDRGPRSAEKLNLQSDLNLALYKGFAAKRESRFPFPQRDVRIVGDGSKNRLSNLLQNRLNKPHFRRRSEKLGGFSDLMYVRFWLFPTGRYKLKLAGPQRFTVK